MLAAAARMGQITYLTTGRPMRYHLYMAKNRKPNAIQDAVKAGRRAAHEQYVAAMRDGVRLRPQTFADRKREASRKACRGRAWD